MRSETGMCWPDFDSLSGIYRFLNKSGTGEGYDAMCDYLREQVG